MSGFDTKIFAVKPCESLDCPICLNILNDPKQCPNGHCFCSGCICGSLQIRSECPVCKVHLMVDGLGRNLHVHNSVHKLQTICISKFNEGSGCEWTGTISDRDHHFEHECGFRVVKCPNDLCSEKMTRQSVGDHLAVCEHRKISCQSSAPVSIETGTSEREHCSARDALSPRAEMESTQSESISGESEVEVPHPAVKTQTQPTHENIEQIPVDMLGTAIEYLNRKGKWIAGNVIGVDRSTKDYFWVYNAYKLRLSVNIDKIRLITGSEVVGGRDWDNTTKRKYTCVNSAFKFEFEGRDTHYALTSKHDLEHHSDDNMLLETQLGSVSFVTTDMKRNGVVFVPCSLSPPKDEDMRKLQHFMSFLNKMECETFYK